jgi:hypothetical protein
MIRSFLLALIPAFVWMIVIGPLLCRMFGVSVPITLLFWKRQSVKMSLSQHVLLEGVLSFGVAMFLYDITNGYVQWRLFHEPGDQPTVHSLLRTLCLWLVAGMFFGLAMAYQQRQELNGKNSTM